MPTIQFYPIDVTYRVEGKDPVIVIAGKTLDGKHIIVKDNSFRPYFYVIPKTEQLKERLEQTTVAKDDGVSRITKVEKVKKKYLGKETEFLKVFTQLPRDVPIIREHIKDDNDIKLITEYDILFKKRYLLDKQITPLVAVQAEGEQVQEKARFPVFHATKIESMEEPSLDQPKIVSFDIETYSPKGASIDMENNPIIMIAFKGADYEKVITWKRFPTKNDYVEFVGSEVELLERTKEIILEQNPDILAGYYSDGFDLPYIVARAKKYKIKLDLGFDFSETQSRRGRTSMVDIFGINHLDISAFIRKTMGQTLHSLTLDHVSEKLLGERKIEVDIMELFDAWDKHPEKLDLFAEYNLKDADLTQKLVEKLLPSLTEFVKIVGMTIPDMARVGFSQLVESYLFKQAVTHKEIAPPLPHQEELAQRRLQTLQGAFVFEPKPGLYENMVVYDYRSLYPSIISSHNLGPSTLNCDCCKEKKLAPVEGKKYWFCTKKKGFLPSMISDLITRRMRIKDILKEKSTPLLEARSQSLKLLANSFYGYLGFAMSRWHSIESARATTAYGRFYIHKVIDGAKAEGFEVLYSDTDSVFVSPGKKTNDDIQNFVEKINAELPGLMELEYEGTYKRGIFVGTKSQSGGAKKKYAMITDDGKLKIKGFETVRRNWSPIAKETQQQVLKIILDENNKDKALKLVKDTIQKLKKNEIELEKVTLRTQITKDLAAYDAIGPHVAIAHRMRQKGIAVGPGSRIEYIISKHGKRIRDRAKMPEEIKQSEYDPEYYINNQLIPAVETIFEVFSITKDDLIGQAQNKLEQFF